jgi:hypothetical protein
VSKFSKVTVFSGLNNLNDITLDDKYSTLLGYTQNELELYFSAWIAYTSEKINHPQEKLLDWVRQWYNGYSWDGRNFVYNPFSILNFFEKCQFQNFWFSSGTPTFLVKMLIERNHAFQELEGYECDQSFFESYELTRLNPVSLLFQTGYLTIKETFGSLTMPMYRLNYPNLEVKESLQKHFLAEFSGFSSEKGGILIYHLLQALKSHSLHDFIGKLQELFSSIPYNMFISGREAYYQTVMYLVLSLLGVHVQCEVQTNQGRIDAIIKTDDTIYILEFKIGKAEQALTQILKKNYAKPYLSQGKKIQLLGIGFDPKKRNIHDWKTQKISG